jgi:hypothetical protein
MMRWMGRAAAGLALGAGLALLHPAQEAAAQQAAAQPTTDAVSSPQAAPHRQAHGGGRHAAAGGTVMRGGDTPSLIAMLPWWRWGEPRPPGSDPAELESPILTACDLWLGFPYATADAQSLTARLAAVQQASEIAGATNKVRVVDPGELNEIDLTAPEEPQSSSRPWLRGLLAIFGGALAVFSAVRYLVA